MQVSLETTSMIGRKLIITIPTEGIDSEVNKRLQDLSRRVRLDGFRPGKVPMKVVKRRYGAGVRQEVLGEMMQSSYSDAIEEQQLNPAGAPLVTAQSDEADGFTFEASFEVYPEITLNSFEGITVERPVAEVQSSDVNDMIETLRKQSTEFVDVERAAQNGDRITYDYIGSKGGEVFDGGSAENATLELGSNRMIPGFEDGLVGVSAGEEKVLSLTFPEDYHAKELAGQAVEFACKVHKVAEPSLPELNDEFFARFGVEEGGEEGFRTEVARNMERELRQAIKNKVKNQALDGLLQGNEVEVPAALTAQEVDRMREQAVQKFGAPDGFDPKQLPAELFSADAEKRVALGLLINEVIRQRELKVNDERVRAMIEDVASAYQQPQEVIDWYYSNNKQLSQLKYVVLEEQVVDTILESAQVTDKPCSYQEAIKPAERARAVDEQAEQEEESA